MHSTIASIVSGQAQLAVENGVGNVVKDAWGRLQRIQHHVVNFPGGEKYFVLYTWKSRKNVSVFSDQRESGHASGATRWNYLRAYDRRNVHARARVDQTYKNLSAGGRGGEYKPGICGSRTVERNTVHEIISWIVIYCRRITGAKV